MTDCPDLDGLLADAERGEPDADARLALHVETCATCTDAEAALTADLAVLRAPACPPDLVARALHEARHGDRPPARPARTQTRRAWPIRLAPLVGMFAAVVIGLAVWSSRGLDVPLPGPTTTASTSPTATEPDLPSRPIPEPESAFDPPPDAPDARARPAAPPREPRARAPRPTPAVEAPRRVRRAPTPTETAIDAQDVAAAQAQLELAFGIVGRAQQIATETITTETRRMDSALRESIVF